MTTGSTHQANYYQVLGANPMDQLDRIEDLFRQFAYEAEQSGDHSKVPLAVEAFKVLRDPARRHQYDMHLSQQQQVAAAQPNQPVQQQPVQQQPVQQQPVQQQPVQQQSVPQQQQPAQQPVQQDQQVQLRQPQGTVQPHAAAVAAQAHAVQPQPQAIPAQPVAPIAPVAPAPPAQVAPVTGNEPPREFCPDAAQRRRREVLAMFYKRRRDDAKNPGIAIGGIEQKVDYAYEVLEFHLWYMQQREWILRLESGMFTITYLGVEEHEKNQIEGLIR